MDETNFFIKQIISFFKGCANAVGLRISSEELFNKIKHLPRLKLKSDGIF